MKVIDLRNIPKEPIYNHTSKGNQPKWHIDDLWYKADHMGYEALSEYIVSQLLIKSNVKDFVSYNLIKILYDETEAMGCVSNNFKKNDEMLIPIEKLHRQYFGIGLADTLSKKSNVREKLEYTVNFIENTTGISNVGKYITIMLSIDAFFINEDRHTNNIAVIRNEKTKTFKMAPIFDNGLSLLSDTHDYKLEKDIYDNIKKVTSKPFSNDFDEQLDCAEELYGAQLKFNFNRTDIINIIEDVMNFYNADIVKRVEKVLLEQMRKYSIFF